MQQSRAESETEKRSLGGAGVGQTSLHWTNAAEEKGKDGKRRREGKGEKTSHFRVRLFPMCVCSEQSEKDPLSHEPWTTGQSAAHYISAVQGEDGAEHGGRRGVKSGVEWERVINGEEGWRRNIMKETSWRRRRDRKTREEGNGEGSKWRKEERWWLKYGPSGGRGLLWHHLGFTVNTNNFHHATVITGSSSVNYWQDYICSEHHPSRSDH